MEAKQCFCIGRQNGEPLCPCRMKNLEQRDGRWVEKPRDFGPVAPRPVVNLLGALRQASGFEDLPAAPLSCRDPEHAPPSMLHVPAGKRYRHVCKTCGNVAFVYPSPATL